MLKPLHFALLLALALLGSPAAAQDFPALSGRVVDAANLLSPEQEAALAQKSEALERASSRQFVIATIPDLQGYEISDYGYRLGRHWGVGQRNVDNGIILIVAPSERKVRIEVGYRLEPIVTDALSSVIIRERILPRFKENDYPGGIQAGADALIEQMQAPPEQAEQRVIEANRSAQGRRQSQSESSIAPLIIWGIVIFVLIIPALFRRGGRGRRYRRRGSGIGEIILWSALDSAMRGGGRSGGGGFWGGGGGGGWGGGGGGGGFSGGGGSFGGGGASGSW